MRNTGTSIIESIVKHVICLRAEYDTKRQQQRGDIHILVIRNNALFCRPDLLSDIKADIKNCQNEFSLYQLEVLINKGTATN